MSLACHTIVGTIRVAPPTRTAEGRRAADDSTLGRLLESLAFQETLRTSASAPIRLVVATRVSRFQLTTDRPLPVRANLPQLALDLAADYEQVQAAAARLA